MALQYLRFTKEVTAGTYQATPPAGDVCLPLLVSDNAFPGRAEPIPWGPIMDAAGTNRPLLTGTAQRRLQGKLSTLHFFSQSVLPKWACNISGTVLTTGSATFDYMYRLGDSGGTATYLRQLGCTCRQFRLTASSGQGRPSLFTAEYDYEFLNTAVITVTDFPTPALTDYPTDAPTTFQLTAGNFTLNSARTKYAELTLTVSNNLTPLYDESANPNTIWWGGRTVSLATRFRLVSGTDRTDFNALTPRACSFSITDGTNTQAYNFQAKGRITNVTDDLPLGGAPYQALTLSGYLDTTAGTDFTLTVTP